MNPTDVGSRSGVNLHHPQTATAGDTCGPGTAMYFIVNWATTNFEHDKNIHEL